MKRRTVIIVLAVQTALMLYSFIYAYVQEGIAKENEMLAMENSKIAIEQTKETLEARVRSENQLDSLSKQISKLKAELATCKKK